MTFPSLRPTVIGSIITPAGLRRLQSAKISADAIEVRVDALLARGATVEELEHALKKRRHPVLLTLRISAEGGQRPWKSKERCELYLRLLPLVEAIDVELATAPSLGEVIAQARPDGKTLVLSAHALKKPATPAQFEQWAKAGMNEPGTILKIASLITGWRDLQRLAAVLVNQPEREIAVMGLGLHAAQSRAVLAALGSRLVYGWLDEAAAPGQPSAAEMRKMVEGLGR